MDTRKPIVLQQNNRYPSYQLYAVAGNALRRNAKNDVGKASNDTDTTFTRCVLHVFDWLRARFKSFEIPQLDMPKPDQADGFTLEGLKSFRLTEPYALEVISLPEDRVWAMQLIEPDPGVQASSTSEKRDPVAGRIFETNIAFRIAELGVECGFRTMVSEPYGSGEVECFRPACVKSIARDPSIGLSHKYRLQDAPIALDDASRGKKLARWVQDPTRQMAVIVIDNECGRLKNSASEIAVSGIKPNSRTCKEINRSGTVNSNPKGNEAGRENASALVPAVMPDFSQLRSSFQNTGLRAELDRLYVSCKAAEGMPVQDKPDIDGDKLARYRMGYAQFFVLTPVAAEAFYKIVGDKDRSRVTIYEPIPFGGNVQRVPDETDTLVAEQIVDDFTSTYPSKKPMTFGSVLFLAGAKDLQNSHIAEMAENREALVRAYEEKIRAMEDRHRDEIAAIRSQVEDSIRENNRLQKVFDRQKEKMGELKEKLDTYARSEQKQTEDAASRDDSELARYRARDRRPKKLADVTEWVQQEFADRLILHKRAKDSLAKVNFPDKNMPRLCDAIEYLATDYRNRLLGLITEDELNQRCAEKYERGFDVRPTPYDSSNPAGTPKDYKIPYYEGFKGKTVESVLDWHLCVGNTSEELIRIYFLYDKTKQLIVVGDLPKHLKTQSYH